MLKPKALMESISSNLNNLVKKIYLNVEKFFLTKW